MAGYLDKTGAKREQRMSMPIIAGQKEKMKMKTMKNMLDEDHKTEIVLCGIAFPKSAVKNREDFTIQKELGSGAFGAVYQGHLHIGPFAR